MSDIHKEAVDKYASKISIWIRDNDLILTHENIRRFFSLYFPASDIKEKSIKEIYNVISHRY